jgi:hypothetical protein
MIISSLCGMLVPVIANILYYKDSLYGLKVVFYIEYRNINFLLSVFFSTFTALSKL